MQAMFLPGIYMREITAILYLNAPSDAPPEPLVTLGGSGAPRSAPAAGALLLYPGADAADDTGATATSVIEISPVGGRLVLFDSRTMLHEVAPHTNPHADRMALTLWVGGPHDMGSLWWTVRWGCERVVRRGLDRLAGGS